MFKQLGYKKRNMLLLAGSFLFLILIYQLSISETLEKRSAWLQAVAKSDQLAEAPRSIARLKLELQTMDDLLGYIESDSLDTQQLILEKVSNYCNRHHIVLKKFPQPQLEEEQNFGVETIRFEVEGDFISLLKLVYTFEQHYNLGKVVSVDFNLEKEIRTQKEHLFATIFIQNIKKSIP